ncbi:MAG TPA: HDOD domain-containing protein [Polyangiales bacterium]|nr:HDOD domain-containing protein [Polyangiales bacterium]
MELKSTLLNIFRSPQYKPPVLPAVALEITSLTRRSNASYEDVVKVLVKDPLLVANILKLAQSPIYGGRQRAQSLGDALNRLGLNTLRDMVWQVAVGLRIFRGQAYASTMERLQLHSTFTAHAARLVAVKAGVAAEHAFLCGLLHDVGWSGALVAVSERVASPPDLPTLYRVIDRLHEEVAGAMGALWSLSPEIVEVIAHHHELDFSETSSSLVSVLCIAEQLADEFDFGIEARAISPEDPRVDEHLVGRFEQSVARLKLEPKLDELRTGAEQLSESLRSMPSLNE